MCSVMSLQEENRVLQGELARLEDLLAHSRADRDELAIKYGAISERVRQDSVQGGIGRVGAVSLEVGEGLTVNNVPVKSVVCVHD